MNKGLRLLFLLVILNTLTGCVDLDGEIFRIEAQSQVDLRAMQSRTFQINDRIFVLKSVIATMQDLDFLLDNADKKMGIVTATKFYNERAFKATISVKPYKQSQTIVRLNARYETKTINDPKIFKDFFYSLSKAMFLKANKIT